MTMPDPTALLAQIGDERSGFNTRPDYSDSTGLIARAMRFFGGNPIRDFSQTSTSTTNVLSLPNVAQARSCVLQVISGSIIFSEGGTSPTTAASMTAGPQTTISLLGEESILGFQWASATAASATIAAVFYD